MRGKNKNTKNNIKRKKTIVLIVRRFFTRDNYVIDFGMTNIRVRKIRILILGGRTTTKTTTKKLYFAIETFVPFVLRTEDEEKKKFIVYLIVNSTPRLRD